MKWFKQHADTVAIIATALIGFYTINEKIENRFYTLSKEIASLEKEVTTIKTVMILKNIMPPEFAKNEEKPK